MQSVVKSLLLAFGTMSLILGVVGIFLPLLPTTPFLLLSAFCYARSSERLHTWLMTNPWFGSYLKNYHEGRGIPRRQKYYILAFLWVTIAYSALFVVPLLWLRILLGLIALAVTVHLVMLKSY